MSRSNMPSIPIIYEDNHLLVVEKPVNVLSQKCSDDELDMLTLLKIDLKERYQKPGDVFLGLVHRLDCPVGGVMVFAKTSKAASRLSEQVRNRAFKKTYFAVVHGEMSAPVGTLKHTLLKNASENKVYVVEEDTPGAKQAVLDYHVIERLEDLSLVKINLQTGRPHQIRVQFATMGHPLFGDQKYGLQYNKALAQLALWSHKISLIHPTSKETMIFHSTPPSTEPWVDFKEINKK